MDTGTFNSFDVEVRDRGIAVIMFNQPERMNGMNPSMKRDLVETLTQAQMDDDVRVVAFTGTGRAFSAGDDLTGGYASGAGDGMVGHISHGHHNPYGTYNGLRTISQAVNVAIRNLDKLSIAAVGGYAIQTGFSLALSCDFRIASTDAKLGSATLRFGLLPDEGGQYLLVQHLGVAKTMDFLMRKRIVSGEEALEMGLVHELCAPEELDDRMMALAVELAEGPQVSMRMLKRSIYNAYEMSWEQSLDEIAAKTAFTDWHADAQDGGKSFVEKRDPVFNRWLERD